MEDVVRESIETILRRKYRVYESWNEKTEDKTSEEFYENIKSMKLIDELLEIFY